MEKKDILKLLESLEKGESSQDEVADLLSSSGMDSLGYAVIDTDRSNRTGIPEVIYSAGKTPLQVAEISERMKEGFRYWPPVPKLKFTRRSGRKFPEPFTMRWQKQLSFNPNSRRFQRATLPLFRRGLQICRFLRRPQSLPNSWVIGWSASTMWV